MSVVSKLQFTHVLKHVGDETQFKVEVLPFDFGFTILMGVIWFPPTCLKSAVEGLVLLISLEFLELLPLMDDLAEYDRISSPSIDPFWDALDMKGLDHCNCSKRICLLNSVTKDLMGWWSWTTKMIWQQKGGKSTQV